MTKLQKLREYFSGKNDGTYISEVEPLLFDKLRSAIGRCKPNISCPTDEFATRLLTTSILDEVKKKFQPDVTIKAAR